MWEYELTEEGCGSDMESSSSDEDLMIGHQQDTEPENTATMMVEEEEELLRTADASLGKVSAESAVVVYPRLARNGYLNSLL